MTNQRAATNRAALAFRTSFLFSALGYEFLFFIMTLRVYAITGRAVTVGIFTALTFLPKLLSSLFGAVVDSVGPRRVLMLAAGAVAAVTTVLGYIDAVAFLYGAWFVLSCLFMLIGNARTVLVSESASAGGSVRNNALVLGFLTGARFFAPLTAGFFVRSAGPRFLIFGAAAMYAACAVSAAFSARNDGRIPAAKQEGTTPSALREGFASIWRSEELRTMAGIGVLWRLFLGMQTSLLVVYITKALGRTVADYGLAMAVVAAGSLTGSLAGPIALKTLKPKVLAGLGLGAHFLCFAALGFIGDYAAALAALGVGHCALYAAVVVVHVKRDRSAKPQQRGKIYGAVTAILTPPAIVSMIVGSALADRYGVGPVFAASGAAATVCFGFICAAWARRRKEPCSIA